MHALMIVDTDPPLACILITLRPQLEEILWSMCAAIASLSNYCRLRSFIANLPLHVSHFNCCLYALNAVILDCRACYIYHLLHCWHQHWAPCYQVCCLIIDDGSLIILLQYSSASTLCPPRAYHCHWLCPGKHGVDAVFSNIVISALCWSITSCGGG